MRQPHAGARHADLRNALAALDVELTAATQGHARAVAEAQLDAAVGCSAQHVAVDHRGIDFEWARRPVRLLYRYPAVHGHHLHRLALPPQPCDRHSQPRARRDVSGVANVVVLLQPWPIANAGEIAFGDGPWIVARLHDVDPLGGVGQGQRHQERSRAQQPLREARDIDGLPYELDQGHRSTLPRTVHSGARMPRVATAREERRGRQRADPRA